MNEQQQKKKREKRIGMKKNKDINQNICLPIDDTADVVLLPLLSDFELLLLFFDDDVDIDFFDVSSKEGSFALAVVATVLVVLVMVVVLMTAVVVLVMLALEIFCFVMLP